ncbi:MAG: putative nucleotide-binding protein, containing PIN domain [Methanosaeta sp. PtaU1.Bin060]|jgi:predicted nucleic acid-binding protein|nr:MAG: putative nucleotide-binding protein, containing PIN domain [Methanosaeta sp. PtaU1.Bin060]
MGQDEEEIRLVVDTNILISALLKDDSITARLLRSNACSCYYPRDGLMEIDCYREYILSKRSKYIQRSSFEHALKFVLGAVRIVPSEMYSCAMNEAFSIMKERDPKDTPFLALALQLGSPLWSNDRHFKGLEAVPVFSTGSLIEHLREKGVWW